MAIVKRKFTCKKCEETTLVQYRQEELREKVDPKEDTDFLILLGICKACYDGKMD